MTIRLIVLTLGASIPVLTTVDAERLDHGARGCTHCRRYGKSAGLCSARALPGLPTAYKALDCERMLFLAGAQPYDGGDDKAAALVMRITEITSTTEVSVDSAAKKPGEEREGEEVRSRRARCHPGGP